MVINGDIGRDWLGMKNLLSFFLAVFFLLCFLVGVLEQKLMIPNLAPETADKPDIQERKRWSSFAIFSRLSLHIPDNLGRTDKLGMGKISCKYHKTTMSAIFSHSYLICLALMDL